MARISTAVNGKLSLVWHEIWSGCKSDCDKSSSANSLTISREHEAGRQIPADNPVSWRALTILPLIILNHYLKITSWLFRLSYTSRQSKMLSVGASIVKFSFALKVIMQCCPWSVSSREIFRLILTQDEKNPKFCVFPCKRPAWTFAHESNTEIFTKSLNFF